MENLFPASGFLYGTRTKYNHYKTDHVVSITCHIDILRKKTPKNGENPQKDEILSVSYIPTKFFNGLSQNQGMHIYTFITTKNSFRKTFTYLSEFKFFIKNKVN